MKWLSKKKYRRSKLGSNDLSMDDIRSWQHQEKEKKAFKSVYKNHAGGYR